MKRDIKSTWRGRKRTQRAYPLNGHRCEVEGCDRPARHRHHIDNDALNTDPSNVVRLCREHHGVFHPGVLTHAEIAEIRRSDKPGRVLGERYGISKSYSNRIRAGTRLK